MGKVVVHHKVADSEFRDTFHRYVAKHGGDFGHLRKCLQMEVEQRGGPDAWAFVQSLEPGAYHACVERALEENSDGTQTVFGIGPSKVSNRRAGFKRVTGKGPDSQTVALKTEAVDKTIDGAMFTTLWLMGYSWVFPSTVERYVEEDGGYTRPQDSNESAGARRYVFG